MKFLNPWRNRKKRLKAKILTDEGWKKVTCKLVEEEELLNLIQAEYK